MTKEKKNRCTLCRKKVGLLGFNCRCEHVFCDGCRNPDVHKCSFDFFEHNKAILKKKNPRVVADKVEAIGGENYID